MVKVHKSCINSYTSNRNIQKRAGLPSTDEDHNTGALVTTPTSSKRGLPEHQNSFILTRTRGINWWGGKAYILLKFQGCTRALIPAALLSFLSRKKWTGRWADLRKSKRFIWDPSKKIGVKTGLSVSDRLYRSFPQRWENLLLKGQSLFLPHSFWRRSCRQRHSSL